MNTYIIPDLLGLIHIVTAPNEKEAYATFLTEHTPLENLHIDVQSAITHCKNKNIEKVFFLKP